MSALRSNRGFQLLFSASAISNLGDGVSALAFPWLATLLTRDPALIAVVASATRLPWPLFSIPAGLIIDRADRKRLMVQADVFSLVLTCGVIGLILSRSSLSAESIPSAYVFALSGLAFLLGSAGVIRDNAAQTALPSIVEKQDLERANGQIWTIEKIMGSFVGPPLAGILIALAVPAPFLLDAATFGVAAVLIWCIVMPPRVAVARRSIWVELLEGVKWLLGNRILLRLALMLGLINALSMMAVTVLILISQEILGLSPARYGILLAAGAAGGVLGGLLGPPIARRLGNARTLKLALVLFPLPYLTIGLSSDPWTVAGALFTEMFAGLLWNVVTVSYRQRMIPDELLGRVNSLYRFIGWGTMPIGALVGGWLVTLAEPEMGRGAALRVPYFIATLGSLALAAYGFLKLRMR
jgi:MFS family permease